MNLDLPSRVPLPDDVRRRALDRALAGIDEPAPRRFRPELVAAAVVVALLAGLTVALSGAGRQDPPLVAAAPAGAVPEVDIRSTEGMIARCAAALDGVPGYPEPARWTVGLQAFGSDGGSTIVVDDAFVCGFTPTTVTVSAIPGTPVGDASLVSVGPDDMVLFNPLRRPVLLDPPSISGAAEPDAAVQFLPAPGPGVTGVDVTVGDSYSGPLPEPAAPAVTVRDRVLPVRPAYGSPEASADDNDVDSCVGDGPGRAYRDLWTPLRRIDDGPVPVLLTRIGDQVVGLCVLAPDGPRFVSGPMPSLEGTTFDPGDPAPNVVVRLSFDVGGTITFEPWTEPRRPDCVVPDGVAVCGDPAAGALTIRLLAPSEDLMVPRVPGR